MSTFIVFSFMSQSFLKFACCGVDPLSENSNNARSCDEVQRNVIVPILGAGNLPRNSFD